MAEKYTLISRSEVAEVNGVVSIYEHIASGAKLVHIANDDPQKLFIIGFRTLPENDTGIAHIMEHSVLNGSAKYPVKEPFVELMKGSLNTFLNAFTAPDSTMYPIMTPNIKDYFNLMDVYLDAVFNPLIYTVPETLRQEGWHYELSEDGKLTVNGVVYNEMKGAMSSPERMLNAAMFAALFDNSYGYNSGGAPEHIPELTEEMFKAFHKRFYHPSNSCTCIYGDMDIEPVLAHIDEGYLSKYARLENLPAFVLQEPFAAPRRVVESYPISDDAEEANKTFVSIGFVCNDSADIETSLAMSILSDMLLNSEAAPLKAAILSAGIGQNVSGGFEDAKQSPFAVVVEGANEGDIDRLPAVVRDCLEGLVKNGLDKKLVLAGVNKREFGLREGDVLGWGAPRGIMYGIQAVSAWNYGADIAEQLAFNKTIASIRKKMEHGYFESLIEKYLLNNPHSALIALIPKTGLMAKKDAEEEARLASLKSGMSEAELAEIKKNQEALRLRQETPDTPEALGTVPHLTLADVDRKAPQLAIDDSGCAGVRVLSHDLFTSGIAYVSALFDMRGLTTEEKQYATLLCFALDKLGTTKRGYAELANDIGIETGGVTASCECVEFTGANGEHLPFVDISTKAVTEKLPNALAIVEEMINCPNLADMARLSQVVSMLGSMQQSSLQERGFSLATTRRRSYYSPTGAFAEAVAGISFDRFIASCVKLSAAEPEKLASALSSVAKKLFTRANLTISITGQEAERRRLCESLHILVENLRAGDGERLPAPFAEGIKNEGIACSSMVQYVSSGYNFNKLGFEYKGQLRAVKNFLSSGYLWNEVRVKGGAYGVPFEIRRNGELSATSYRDPNLMETLEVYKRIAAYLRETELSPSDIENMVISAVADLDEPMNPQTEGKVAVRFFLAGLTPELRQRERDELISTTVADVRAAADMFEAVFNKNCICVFGNSEKLRANAGMFGEIVNV